MEGGESRMEEIMKHYGSAILTTIVLLALGAVIVFLLKADGGFVSNAFKDALEGFFTNMGNLAP